MTRFSSVLLLFTLLITASCKSEKKNAPKGIQRKKEATENVILKGNWYKRFTGTIAGKPVVASFLCSAENNNSPGSVSASYFYDGKSDIIFLSQQNAEGDKLVFAEYLRQDVMEDEEKPAHTWIVKFSNSTIKGKWKSADGKKIYDIDLTENYNGALKLDVITDVDSAVLSRKKFKATAYESISLPVASKQVNKRAADFFTSSMLTFLDGERLIYDEVSEYIGRQKDTFYKFHAETIEDENEDLGEMNNWEESEEVFPIYNNRNILILERYVYNYTGGAHGNYGSRYLCLDLKEQKTWKLEDILYQDSVDLQEMLEQMARKMYGIDEDADLSERLLVDTIHVTDNIYFSDAGITFCYNPYEIASFADGQVSIFLSYKQLRPALTPAFRKRMKLL